MVSNLAASVIERIRYREKDMKHAIEKANMGREIHDSVGNTFVQAVLLSDTIRRNTTNSDVQEQALNLKKILSDGINDMRDLLWAVEQNEAKLGDLVYYINHKIDSLSAQPGIKFNLNTSLAEEDKLIPPTLKLNIIRIIQESVTNIIKHANATVVDIMIHQKGEELLVLVKDNGIGFDMENMKQKDNSYGMRNIKKRCEEIGGFLIIDSTPSKGTEVSVTVPIGNN
jgi:NarL family two-component system sensor histidine kinase LiaS